jgi:3'(2'), 5'-bisphosphate nucleotidase
MTSSELLPSLLSAVWDASRCCEKIAAEFESTDTQTKSDQSPVTVADYASQALIHYRLKELTPDIGIVAEEGAAALQENPELIQRVAAFTSRIHPEVNEDSLLGLLDHGEHPGGEDTFWTLDPIDGTKGYLRGGQYAIALALVKNGRPILGVLGCPRYVMDDQTGVVFAGGEEINAQVWTSETAEPRRIRACSELSASEARLCESVESAHTAHDLSAKVIRDLGISDDILRIDSQAKYAAVARGEAGLYLRLPVKKGYREKIWDHAAGLAVIQAAGGRVTDLNGNELDFGQGETLKNNRGVIASNGTLHHAALAALNLHTPDEMKWG